MTVLQMVETGYRYVQAETATRLNISEWSVANLLNKANIVHRFYAATFKALTQGKISVSHVEVIVEAGRNLTDGHKVFEDRVLSIAETTTPGRLRTVARQVVEEVIAETGGRSFEERHEVALKGRDVVVTHLDDGVSQVRAIVDTVTAVAIADRLNRFVRAVKTNLKNSVGEAVLGDGFSGDNFYRDRVLRARLTGEVRADIFADLLLTGDPTVEASCGGLFERVKAVVQVVIPADALTGSTGSGGAGFGFVAGVGPVSAEMVRRLAATAGVWQRVFTDPLTGFVTGVDSYRPTRQMRRYLGVRDEHCRFPGCRVKPERADIDHTVAWQDGGVTRLNNLAYLCRKHHVLKHLKFVDGSRWRVEQDGAGRLRWVSALGYEKVEVPGSSVRFINKPPPF